MKNVSGWAVPDKWHPRGDSGGLAPTWVDFKDVALRFHAEEFQAAAISP